jgi:hypothetical protein
MNMDDFTMPVPTEKEVDAGHRTDAVRYALRYFEIFPTEDHDLLGTAEAIYDFINGEKA